MAETRETGAALHPNDLPPTDRTAVTRHPERGSRDRQLVYRILDEGLVAHVGLVWEGSPLVVPMGYGRQGDRLILHGSVNSRLLQALGDGVDACVTVTLLDGLVLARSTFHHSMNYRSVVAFGRARRIEGDVARRQALDALVEHLVPGRSHDARGPSTGEMMATEILEFPITEASAKVREGPPIDAAGDLALPVWAGVVPLAVAPGDPIAAPDLVADIPPPDYARSYRRP